MRRAFGDVAAVAAANGRGTGADAGGFGLNQPPGQSAGREGDDMPQLVSGIYADPASAQAAVQAIKQYGCGDETIVQLPPANDAMAALLKAGLSRADATATMKKLSDGGSMVGVRAPFGHAGKLLKLIDAQHPKSTDILFIHESPGTGAGVSWSNAAPLSALLGLPVLSNEPFPFSKFFNVPILAANWFLSAWLGLRMLIDEPAPLSKTLNIKTLSNDATPLSNFFGFATLSKNPTPFSSLLGMKVLLD
jgi:hypothetical protein